MGLKLLEMNEYMFHVEFSLGGYHKRILLPTGRWEPGQTDQNGSHPQQSFTESTYSWHFFQQIFLQVSYQADNISQLETRSINYSHGCLHTGLVHNAGQVIFQSTLEHDRQSSIPSMPTECPRVGPCGTSLESSNLIPNSTTCRCWSAYHFWFPNLQRQSNWCVRTTFQTSFLN